MARPPRPNQKRYRGRLRSDIRSSLNHMNRLIAWNVRYLAYPIASYPNQLAPPADMTAVAAAAVVMFNWLAAKGPIPSR